MNKVNSKQTVTKAEWMDLYIVSERDLLTNPVECVMFMAERGVLVERFPWMASLLPPAGSEEYFTAEIHYGAKHYRIWQAE